MPVQPRRGVDLENGARLIVFVDDEVDARDSHAQDVGGTNRHALSGCTDRQSLALQFRAAVGDTSNSDSFAGSND